MRIDTKAMKWTRAPKEYTVTDQKIEIITEPFTDMELTECKWLAHDGQQPDEE